MTKRTFRVFAKWDAEAQVYYSESDIKGLHIETQSLDEFEEILLEVAPELIAHNHLSEPSITNKPLAEYLPAILWQRPQEDQLQCA